MPRVEPTDFYFNIRGVPIHVEPQELLKHQEITEYDVIKVLEENQLIGTPIDESYEGELLLMVGGKTEDNSMDIEVGFSLLERSYDGLIYCSALHFMPMRDKIRYQIGYDG